MSIFRIFGRFFKEKSTVEVFDGKLTPSKTAPLTAGMGLTPLERLKDFESPVMGTSPLQVDKPRIFRGK